MSPCVIYLEQSSYTITGNMQILQVRQRLRVPNTIARTKELLLHSAFDFQDFALSTLQHMFILYRSPAASVAGHIFSIRHPIPITRLFDRDIHHPSLYFCHVGSD